MAEPGTLSHYDALASLKPDDLSFNAWAVKAGVNRSFFVNLKAHDNPSSETLARLLEAIGVSEAQYVAARYPDRRVLTEVRAGGVTDRRQAWDTELPRMPHLGSAVGGEWGEVREHIELTELDLGEVLEWVVRPNELAEDPLAYRLTIVGDSMSPRFRPGDRVEVSPRASVGLGDDVIVQLRGPDVDDDRVRMVLIKQLVRRTGAAIRLRQFNPEVEFDVPLQRIVVDGRGRTAIHRVRGAIF
ncbi:MAG: helix-turn-helix transcriptional regulator [Sphingomonas sp.]